MTGDTADAVVIGSGPNGLAAALLLARKGWDVTVLERETLPGGAVRTEPLTEPGYRHDTFSGFYGLLHSSPAFRLFGLDRQVEWAHFDLPVAAAVAPGRAGFIHRDLDRTVDGLAKLDPADGEAWRDLVSWWQATGRHFHAMMLAPLGAIRPTLRFARKTGIRNALATAQMLLAPIEQRAADRFRSDVARALYACGVSHADVSAAAPGSTPMTMILAMLGQAYGFPVPVGGAGELTRALVDAFREAGGVLRTGTAATRVVVSRGRAVAVETAGGGIVRARHAVLADTVVTALCRDLVGEEHLPARYLDGIRRYRYGSGVFKVDLALDGVTPWLVEEMRRTGVVHITGSLRDMARAHFDANHGALPAQPMLIIGQQSVADPSRAPDGGHTLWIETHVPPQPVADGAGLLGDIDGWGRAREPFLDRVLDLIERHAPGVRDRIVGMAVHTPDELQAKNPNLVGGDIGGGSGALHQQLVFRPVPGWFRYRTPIKGLYLCSASTHPGGGVHLMCGVNAARRALKDSWRPAGVLRTAGGGRRRPRAV